MAWLTQEWFWFWWFWGLRLNCRYRAAVSWTDHNVGLLLGELDTLGLADNTAVSFLGDHGCVAPLPPSLVTLSDGLSTATLDA